MTFPNSVTKIKVITLIVACFYAAFFVQKSFVYRSSIKWQKDGALTHSTNKYDALRRCKSMFTIDKSKHQKPGHIEALYEDLSQELPSLLPDNLKYNESYSSFVYPGTRLHIMNGSIPYVPCKELQFEACTFSHVCVSRITQKVREYKREDFSRCCALRKSSKDSPVWVAFVGDSSMRLKLYEFINLLPEDLIYSYYLGKKEVTEESFVDAIIRHKYRPSTFDIFGHWPNNNVGDSKAPSQHLNTSMQDVLRFQDKDKRETPNDLPTSLNHRKDLESNLNTTLQENSSINENDENGSTVYDEHQETRSEKFNENEQKPYVADYVDTNFSEEQLTKLTYQVRLSLVWAPDGSRTGHPFSRRGKKVTVLNDWIAKDVVPDIVVIGYGKWPLLLREYEDELVPFSELDYFSRPLIHVLEELSARTKVLLWSQSRYRWFNFESEKYSPGSSDLENYWNSILFATQFSHGIPLIDTWLWELFRGTGIWQWDSTLPFNLANLNECKLLNDHYVDSYPPYQGRWWNCADIHHSSYETSHIEIQMILNLLCNSVISPGESFCCTDK